MKIKIMPTARKDLSSIAHYTEQEWGLQQRREYLNIIDNKIKKIAGRPELGKKLDRIAKGLHSQNIEKHMIYYWVKNDYVEILTILHMSMDIDARLAVMFKGR